MTYGTYDIKPSSNKLSTRRVQNSCRWGLHVFLYSLSIDDFLPSFHLFIITHYTAHVHIHKYMHIAYWWYKGAKQIMKNTP